MFLKNLNLYIHKDGICENELYSNEYKISEKLRYSSNLNISSTI